MFIVDWFVVCWSLLLVFVLCCVVVCLCALVLGLGALVLCLVLVAVRSASCLPLLVALLAPFPWVPWVSSLGGGGSSNERQGLTTPFDIHVGCGNQGQ